MAGDIIPESWATSSGIRTIDVMAMDDGVPPRKRRVTLEQRRALQLLACSPFGAAGVTMLTHGFTRGTLAGLVHVGLAMAQHDAPDRRLVGRIRITEAGRRVIGD
jgi:hypothetical protein